MKFSIATAIAAASMIAILPAHAEPTAAPAPAATEAADKLPAAKRYCYKTEATGTRISKRVCRTRDEWKAEGVTVPANL